MRKVGIVLFRYDLIGTAFDNIDFSIINPYDISERCVCRGGGSWAGATKGKIIIHGTDVMETVNRVKNCDIVILSFVGNQDLVNDNDIVAISLLLKEENKVVFFNYAESLRWLELELGRRPSYIAELIDIASSSNCDAYCFSATSSKSPLGSQLAAITNKPAEFIPYCFSRPMTPKFRIDPTEREGIVLPQGIFDIRTPRYSFGSMVIASRLRQPTTLIWKENIRPLDVKNLKCLFLDQDKINVIYKESGIAGGQFAFNWHDYIKVIAKHRICIDMDLSYTAGGFSGDAFLMNVPCLGGNSDTATTAFPNLISDPTDMNEIISVAEKLLEDDEFYEKTIKEMDERIDTYLSFENNVKIWDSLYEKYKSN